ncbi:MAG: hypothetical protein ABIP94_01625, partial [Planctomycetota bacterium]
MRERTRRWLMRAAWALLLVSGSLVAGLRIGRPAYYTDGRGEVTAQQLATSGMLRWQSPEVLAELPGPVQGRVAALPDGRLVYGRSGAEGTSDLVVWDPLRPAVSPEPLYGLNTEHNELAPAFGPDGRFYFASDRPSGVGGYDLYVATSQNGRFSAPTALTACNTQLDETDPAPSDNGSDFVFVRIDRRSADGNDGVLHRWQLDSDVDPRPVFASPERRTSSHVDRDPAFAPGSGALWFVRRARGEPLRLLRSSICAGVFDAPLVVGADWGARELRAPLPSADGTRLGLLQPRIGDGAADLWFRARATELYPWWPGQRWLEWILLAVMAICGLLLLLLHLGRRWSTLDLVAQCLLLSLLLHILLFLWLMGVEISDGSRRGNEHGGSLEVTLVAAADSSSASADGQHLDDLSARVQFAPSERSLAAAAPGTSPEREAMAAALEGPSAEWQHSAEAKPVAVEALVRDAAAMAQARDGQDAAAATAATELPAVAAAAPSAAAARMPDNASERVVAVVLPGAAVAKADPDIGAFVSQPQRSEQLPEQGAMQAVQAPKLLDATAATASASSAPRQGSDAGAASVHVLAELLGVDRAGGAEVQAAREAGATSALPNLAAPDAPDSTVERGARAPLFVPAPSAAAALAAPSARAATASVALREDAGPADVQPMRSAPATAASPKPTPILAAPVGPTPAQDSVRPQRADELGVLAAPTPALVPPGSSLARAAEAPAAPPRLGQAAVVRSANARAVGDALTALRDAPAPASGTAAPVATAAATAVPRLGVDVRVREPVAGAIEPVRRAAAQGTLAAPVAMADAPGSSLARVASALQTPQASNQTSTVASANARAVGGVALLRDARSTDVAVPAAAAAAAAVTRGIDVRIREPLAGGLEPSRRASADGTSAAPVQSLEPPGSALARATVELSVPQRPSQTGAVTAANARPVGAAPLALRDARAPANGAPEAAIATTAEAMLEPGGAVRVRGPLAAAFEAPRRAGLFPAALPRIVPPGSLLERAPQASLRAPAAVA